MKQEAARYNMLSQQIRTCNVRDDHIINTIRNTPREHFVPERYRDVAFAEMQLPIGHNQVMMTPLDEARLLQALQLKPSDTVLEIGTGTGYLTALLAKLAKYVYSVDIFPDFTELAKHKLETIQLHNFSLQTGDAVLGWEQNGPYDVIVISGSLPTLSKNWLRCVRENGKIFTISGIAPIMHATLISDINNNKCHVEFLYETNIPPLLNATGGNTFLF